MVTGASTCPRCGATPSGPNVAEQAERIRLRLQEAIGDSYRLIELLGRGGMGIVFRALELALDREVALKVLALDPVLSPEAYARFEREAKLAARLDHPNVVPIFAVGQRNTVAYYTMRLVRGGTLEDMLEGHRSLDFVHATEILKDVASALDYAHGQGVVHRDIKPANVLISDSGHAMVSDFGIARGLGVGETALASGAVIGSPGYMSPEQWRGEEIDARADEYALGVMAFEMLTGHRPFETVRVQDLLKLHLTAEVPNASSIKPSLPPFVDLAIKRAMHKNATARFATASAFVEALSGRRPVATGTRTSVPIVMEPIQTGGLSPGTKVIIALTFVALAVIAGVVGVLHPGILPNLSPPPAPPHTDTTPTPPDSVLNVDTTFDLNANAPSNVRSHGRAPVAVDPTLFPAQAPPPDANADAAAYIHVIVRGGAARVRVDGRMLGFTPLVVRVDPGPHLVSLESSGDAFLPAQITVNAMPNDTSIAAFAARVAGNSGLDTPPAALPAPSSGSSLGGNAPTSPQGAAPAGRPVPSMPTTLPSADSASSLPPSNR
jgi:serine/threonine protein kinase